MTFNTLYRSPVPSIAGGPVISADIPIYYYNKKRSGEALHSGDLERLVALYESDAVLAPQPGELVWGRGEIREQVRNLPALEGELRAEAIRLR